MAGELALNGEVRPIKGVLPIAIEARRQRKKAVIVPKANVREAAVVEGIEVYGVTNLRETFEFLARQRELQFAAEAFDFTKNGSEELDFCRSERATPRQACYRSSSGGQPCPPAYRATGKRKIDVVETDRNHHAAHDHRGGDRDHQDP